MGQVHKYADRRANRSFQVTCPVPERRVAGSTPRFACRLNYTPGGVDLFHSLYLFLQPNPLLRLFISYCFLPLLTLSHIRHGRFVLKELKCKCHYKNVKMREHKS